MWTALQDCFQRHPVLTVAGVWGWLIVLLVGINHLIHRGE